MTDKSHVAIEIDHISKEYQLGTIGHGTLYRDLQTWWAKLRGNPDPNALVFVDAEVGKKNLNQSFKALDEISLVVNKGDIIGIIGRNGAGKSTLLKLLSRISAPSRGEIRINGRIASLLEVGTGFHSELTGRENIYLNGTILGMTREEIESKFDEIVAFSELEKFIDTPVKRYSSGMTVRLAFSIAAHLEPEILIVDEVLAVGDTSFRKKCIGKMQGISRDQSRTILFVSHDMGAIRNLCTRCVVLEKGRVIHDGDVEAAVKAYSEINKVNERKDGIYEFPQANSKYPVRIAKATLYNGQGEVTSQIESMARVTLSVDLEGAPPQGGFNLEWRLFSYRGDALAYGSSYALDARTYGPTDLQINCRIDSLMLAAGEYHMTLMLRVWGQEAWDYIERAIVFDVLPHPHEETGFEYAFDNCGPLSIPQVWY
jgi:lipopolysaccharide transport system ATP-binding protein